MSKPRAQAGWMTRSELMRVLKRPKSYVDALLREGLPHHTVGTGRGTDIRIPRDQAMAWLAERAEKDRPQAPARPEPEPVPPSALILEHVTDPVHGGLVIGALQAIYATSWYGKCIAEREGVDPATAGRICGGVSMMLVAHFERSLREAGVEAFQGEAPEWLQPEQFWWRPDRGLRPDLRAKIPAAEAK